jgi:hypothetical protein
MALRQFRQHTHSFIRKRQHDSPSIGWIFGAPNQTFRYRPVRKFDYAVLAQSKPARQVADRRHPVVRYPGDLQQQLMLSRSELIVLCYLFAELQKVSQMESELSQCAEQVKRKRGLSVFCVHGCIVSRYITRYEK